MNRKTSRDVPWLVAGIWDVRATAAEQFLRKMGRGVQVQLARVRQTRKLSRSGRRCAADGLVWQKIWWTKTKSV